MIKVEACERDQAVQVVAVFVMEIVVRIER